MTEPYNATRSAQLASHRRGLDDLERELESMEDWRAAMAAWKSDMVVMVESHRAIDGRSSGGTTWDEKKFRASAYAWSAGERRL
jgi:hypothetical protein